MHVVVGDPPCAKVMKMSRKQRRVHHENGANYLSGMMSLLMLKCVIYLCMVCRVLRPYFK